MLKHFLVEITYYVSVLLLIIFNKIGFSKMLLNLFVAFKFQEVTRELLVKQR